MILSDKKQKRGIWWRRLLLLSPLLLILLFIGFSVLRPTDQADVYYCDLERFQGGQLIGTNDMPFSSGATRSRAVARSGQYASQLEVKEGFQYGVGFNLTTFEPGEMYRATIWRHQPEGGQGGYLVVSGEGEGKFYQATASPFRRENGWDQLLLQFKIPVYKSVENIKIYCYTEGNVLTYFDDLKIERIEPAQDLGFEEYELPILNLNIKEKQLSHLKNKRSTALQTGLLESQDEDWVNARLESSESENLQDVRVRLKGDWLDHLSGDKWSFRCKMKGENRWNRLRHFSLHTPAARNFLMEYVLHRLFEQEDVLTTYYDFVQLSINQRNLGIYAVEEHFTKILVERQKRREGPIIRFSEEGFWTGIKRHLFNLGDVDHGLEHTVKKAETSEITPFEAGKTIKSPVLRRQFEIATNLLNQYKYAQREASEVFDLPKMAKYYAICDALGAYHGLAWHNQRFYYNPITSKLEPIGFDGFGDEKIRNNAFIGQGALNHQRISAERLEDLLFLDTEFTALYTRYLEQYTARDFLDLFLARIKEDVRFREAVIQQEFPNYSLNLDDIIVRAQRMHVMVLPFNDLSLKAYTQKTEGKLKQIRLANTHGLPIQVIGTGPRPEQMTDTLGRPWVLEAYLPVQRRYQPQDSLLQISSPDMFDRYLKKQPLRYRSLEIPKSHRFIFFQPLGLDTTFYTNIRPTPAPDFNVPAQQIKRKKTLQPNDWIVFNKKTVVFKSGKHRSNQNIIIPHGRHVIFEPGCEIDFYDGAAFISYSPVFMRGTEEAPIRIYSSDQSAQGFSVLETFERSELKHTIFDHFNTLNQDGWTLTGAVTFYESPVDIQYCVFRNNHCEDALNLVRSKFVLKNSLVANTFSDGFDADFCKGSIDNCVFQNTGNDGMDFSGSVIAIWKTKVQQAGDKGVSVGEDSEAQIFELTVVNANIGLAAKDLSEVTVDQIWLDNCEQGFAAYQKKAEYGGSSINVRSYTTKDVKRLYNIQKSCVLQLDGQRIIGE